MCRFFGHDVCCGLERCVKFWRLALFLSVTEKGTFYVGTVRFYYIQVCNPTPTNLFHWLVLQNSFHIQAGFILCHVYVPE